MTNEDAWANLKFFIEPNNTETKDDYIEELNLAIKALKKQIPMMPRLHGEYGFIKKKKLYTCPYCGNVLLTKKMNERQDTSFCWDCGQRLNWIGVEDDK